MLSCTWDEEFELLGYIPGAKINFVVGDEDLFKADDVLGKFQLSSDKFEKAAFDEEVELPEAQAKKTGAFLKVKVSLAPLSVATADKDTTTDKDVIQHRAEEEVDVEIKPRSLWCC